MPLKRIQLAYKEFQNMREEIMKHKWIESEKVGYDVGFQFAITDWMKNHRENWIKSKRERELYDR
jgi:hypothetical protein